METLENYKNHLINHYVYEYDNSTEKRLKRKVLLERKLSDEELSKIITDSYSFIKDIFKNPTLEHGYCSYELELDTTEYISLNLVGGYHSDILFTDDNHRLISRYILKKVFGPQFMIYVNEELEDFKTDDPDIVCYDYRYYLYMQGFPNNLKEIEESLFPKNKILVKE